MRRNRIGTKSSELWGWQVEDIKKMTGPLAVQQYIQELIRFDASCIDKIIECPPQVDLNVWKYQHVRQFVLQLNLLVTTLKEVCSKKSCPSMKGSDGNEFLCAAHKTAQNCSAFDYMNHNLDQATSILLNIKNYSNRSSISEAKSLDTIVRRLYRLFSHTYFHHKAIFEQFQADMFLCERFTNFTLKYELLQQNMINIPKTAFKHK